MNDVVNGKYFKHQDLEKKVYKELRKSQKLNLKMNSVLGNKLQIAFNTTDIDALNIMTYLHTIQKKVKYNFRKWDNILESFVILDLRVPHAIVFGVYKFAELAASKKNAAQSPASLRMIYLEFLCVISNYSYYFSPRTITEQLIIVFNAHKFIEALIPFKKLLNTLQQNARYNICMQGEQLKICVKYNSNKACGNECPFIHVCVWCWSPTHNRTNCIIANEAFAAQRALERSKFNNNNNNNVNRFYNRNNNNAYTPYYNDARSRYPNADKPYGRRNYRPRQK